jgi:hypothetical protein
MEQTLVEKRVRKDRDILIEYNFSENISESICTTCIHAKTCIYYARSRYPVMFCEEFSSGSAALKTAVEVRGKDSSVSKTNARGLCANCELRDTCTFPDKETGVWYCEEYR